jgi:hypothetical protein
MLLPQSVRRSARPQDHDDPRSDVVQLTELAMEHGGIDPEKWLDAARRQAYAALAMNWAALRRCTTRLLLNDALTDTSPELLAIKTHEERRDSARRVAALRAGPVQYSDHGVSVDAKAGVIRNVAIATVGPAKGHGFDLDQTSIEQLATLANAMPDGVKVRFRHPAQERAQSPDGQPVDTLADSTGTMVGRVKNVHVVGNQARGDVYLGGYAAMLPGLGNVRDYLLAHAVEDPAAIGMSAMFVFDVEPIVDRYGGVTALVARIQSLEAVDFVDQPAANPAGLLSAPARMFDPQPPSGWQDATPKPPATAPLPASTPDTDGAERQYLLALVKRGPQRLADFAAQCATALEGIRAALESLVSTGCATNIDGVYRATAAGLTQAAMCWN